MNHCGQNHWRLSKKKQGKEMLKGEVISRTRIWNLFLTMLGIDFIDVVFVWQYQKKTMMPKKQEQ
jgi:hypothetical protein